MFVPWQIQIYARTRVNLDAGFRVLPQIPKPYFFILLQVIHQQHRCDSHDVTEFTHVKSCKIKITNCHALRVLRHRICYVQLKYGAFWPCMNLRCIAKNSVLFGVCGLRCGSGQLPCESSVLKVTGEFFDHLWSYKNDHKAACGTSKTTN